MGVASSAGLKRAFGEYFFVVHRQDQYGDAGLQRLDRFDEVRPAHALQRDVDDGLMAGQADVLGVCVQDGSPAVEDEIARPGVSSTSFRYLISLSCRIASAFFCSVMSR